MENNEKPDDIVEQVGLLVANDSTPVKNETKTTKNIEFASPEVVELLNKRQTFSSSELLPIVTSISCGIIFGIAFNKSRMFEPYFIIQQMLFTRFLMLKFFLSAAGTSCFIGVLASRYYPEHFTMARSKFRSANNGFTICLGSLILGSGMSICGSCPGTVFIQIGAGVPNSWIVLMGALLGALVFGLIDPIFKKFSSGGGVYMKYVFIDEGCKISGKVIGIVFGVLFWSMVVAFEWLFPWQTELNTTNHTNCNWLGCGSWPPEISGFIVGLVQMPLISVLGTCIGFSTFYVCIMGQWIRLTNNADSFQLFKNQLNRWWQVFFALSAVYGSWIAVGLNLNQSNLNVIEHPYDNVTGVSEIRAIVGGFMIVFGSTMGKGCPSGHGFSGFMLMTTAAILAVPCIFVGGIATAFVMQSYGF